VYPTTRTGQSLREPTGSTPAVVRYNNNHLKSGDKPIDRRQITGDETRIEIARFALALSEM